MVKIKLLENIDIGEKGEIVNTTKKGAKHYVDINIAEYVETSEEQKTKKKIEVIPEKEKNDIKLEDSLLEPVLNNNEPKWLIIKTKIKQQTNQDKKLIENGKLESEYEVIFDLKEPGMWQCNKCANVVQNLKGQPEYCTQESGGCNRTSTFTQITKQIKEEIWKLPVWKEQQVNTLDIYDSMNDLVRDFVVFPEEIHYKIFNLWIISTWKLGCWETVGFPVFRGIMGSGKTRALNIIRELAYRSVPASSATFAAVARLSHHWHVTLTIDEANNRLNKRTERGAELLDFVKQSYKVGSKYISADMNNQEEVVVSNNFGFKSFAGERSFDPALVNRGIDFFMEKAIPPTSKIEYSSEEFDRLRTMLLNYRYKTSDPPDLGENYILKGRTREVYESIIATGIHIGVEIDDVIGFAQEKEKEEEDDLQGTIQHEILKIIKNNYQENETLDDSPEEIEISRIAEDLGWTEKKDKQKLGYILKNLGLKRKHKTTGSVLSLTDRSNNRRLGYLYRRYKV